MLSVRAKGASVPTVVGEHLGTAAKHFMNLFAVVVLLMLVGVVFVEPGRPSRQPPPPIWSTGLRPSSPTTSWRP
jgi:hypothetical protein